ncbi:EamA family transporter [Paenibacillus sp. LHD-117]|uniref:EamA family transporter n=1 Tax=Paenibacillus sp. LHD-117 TaxID=3071412 RepID=UPI0027DFE3B0|nr:EamA family transporter [Paenibacillus sp. LHD-117]MDQ6421228.1 EamA family transporter [Paenibacillus sp. LHD-117]
MLWLTLSVLAAVAFGVRGMLYHWTSQKPVNRNLMLCGVFGMGAIVNLAGAIMLSSEWTLGCLVGIQMGLFSFGANASMFKGFAVGKASLVAILTALPAVVVVLAAYWLWDERIGGLQMLAFAIIVGGVLLVRYSNELTLSNLQGAQWGLLAMLLFAGNDLSGKWSTLLGAELLPTLFFMFATGTACFGLWWMADVRRERMAREFAVATVASVASSSADGPPAGMGRREAWSGRKTFVTGLAVGLTNTAGMLLIVSAFDIGKAGLVSAVVALNVPLVLLYTRFVVKEKFSRTETAGILLSLAGILLMRLFGD